MNSVDKLTALKTKYIKLGRCILEKKHLILSLMFVFFIHKAVAQESVLTLEIKGELTPELRNAMSRVFTPNAAESYFDISEKKQRTLNELCKQFTCIKDAEQKLRQLTFQSLVQSSDRIDNYNNITRVARIDIESDSWFSFKPSEESYLVLEGREISAATENSEELYAFKLRDNTSLPEMVASKPIPKNTLFKDTDSIVNVIPFNSITSDIVDKLEQDIAKFNYVRREFLIPSEARQEDVDKLLRITEKSNVVRARKTQYFTSDYELSTAKLTYLSNETECKGRQANHPFDKNKLMDVLEFNVERLYHLGISNIQAGHILVVDTGLGEALYDDTRFREFLKPDLSEALYSNYFYKDLTYDEQSKRCLNPDGIAKSFTYGYTPDFSDTECLIHTSKERLAPLESPDADESYNPSHGSVVSTLAIGGLETIESHDFVSQLVELKIARVTRFAAKNSQYIKTDSTDLKDALYFARVTNIPIINLSLSVDDAHLVNELSEELLKFNGLAVVAAGNEPILINPALESFPAGLSEAHRDTMIVVGALNTTDASQPNLWTQSSYSSEYVDIAAPGVDVLSYDHKGEKVCATGTSISAPLVSFTAALLYTFGLPSIKEIKSRILATADHEKTLSQKVNNGRVLNIHRAADVFRDFVWIANETLPRKGYLIREDGEKTLPVMLQLCDSTASNFYQSRGVIDASILHSWYRNGDEAVVWHRLGRSLNTNQKPCSITRIKELENVHFYDTNLKEVLKLSLQQIDRIVTSPYRKHIQQLLETESTL